MASLRNNWAATSALDRPLAGAASVRGVRCEVMVGRVDAGELAEEVTEEFGLEAGDVKATAYVWSTAA